MFMLRAHKQGGPSHVRGIPPKRAVRQARAAYRRRDRIGVHLGLAKCTYEEKHVRAHILGGQAESKAQFWTKHSSDARLAT